MQYPSLTRDQIRELDRVAIQDFGIPGLILMENAGRACVAETERMLGETAGKHIVVFCGEQRR